MSTIWTALIAVCGTLAGGLLTGLWTSRTNRLQRREARRAESVRAVADLVSALSEHRMTMYLREEKRLAGTEKTTPRGRRARRAAASMPLVGAVAALAAALSEHRSAMYLREEKRLTGAAADKVEKARDRSHETRAAITAPLVMVSVLSPALAEAARRAESATYALRNAPDLKTLATLRTAALAAVDQLVREAGHLFADHDTPRTPAPRASGEPHMPCPNQPERQRGRGVGRLLRRLPGPRR